MSPYCGSGSPGIPFSTFLRALKSLAMLRYPDMLEEVAYSYLMAHNFYPAELSSPAPAQQLAPLSPSRVALLTYSIPADLSPANNLFGQQVKSLTFASPAAPPPFAASVGGGGTLSSYNDTLEVIKALTARPTAEALAHSPAGLTSPSGASDISQSSSLATPVPDAPTPPFSTRASPVAAAAAAAAAAAVAGTPRYAKASPLPLQALSPVSSFHRARQHRPVQLLSHAFSAIELDKAKPASLSHNATVFVDRGAADATEAAEARLAELAHTPPRTSPSAPPSPHLPPLLGIPILVTEAIALAGGGGLTRDAPCLLGLRRAGAVLLGKTLHAPPYARPALGPHWLQALQCGTALARCAADASRCAGGGSAGAAAAVAAGFAPGAVGLGSIAGCICLPAALNGCVGMQATLGLTPREGTIPMASTGDAPGPLARTVADCALLLSLLAGGGAEGGEGRGGGGMLALLPPPPCASQAALGEAAAACALAPSAGGGTFRVGALVGPLTLLPPATAAVYLAALDRLRRAGVVVEEVDVSSHPACASFYRAAQAHCPGVGGSCSSHADTFGSVEAGAVEGQLRQAYCGVRAGSKKAQAQALGAVAALGDAATQGCPLAVEPAAPPFYLSPRAAGPLGVDRVLEACGGACALVAPTAKGPAEVFGGGVAPQWGLGAGYVAAAAGYPHLTIPMGEVGGLPLGLSFIGTAWSDALLLKLGAAFEAMG